jgi:hypothetical protein
MKRWCAYVLLGVAGCGCVARGERPEVSSEVARGLWLSSLLQQQQAALTSGSYGTSWSGGYDRTLRLYQSSQQSTVTVPSGREASFWNALQASVAAQIDAQGKRSGESGCESGGIWCQQYRYQSGKRGGVVELLAAPGHEGALHIMLLTIEHRL